MTGETPAIEVGSLALATRASGVCDAGERGVCYEVSTLGGRPGYSFLFEQGRYDGFSPEDVTICLTITGEVCAAVADYQFTNVVRLQRDVDQGRFAAAFPPRPLAPPRNGTKEHPLSDHAVFPSTARCWKCGERLVELRPPLYDWRYYCRTCQHLTAPQAELEAAMATRPAGAVGVVAAWPLPLHIDPV